ncbi:hypothetical protein K8I31_05065, partial [bacterium]|nr:hypothetical protein [bacterium]
MARQPGALGDEISREGEPPGEPDKTESPSHSRGSAVRLGGSPSHSLLVEWIFNSTFETERACPNAQKQYPVGCFALLREPTLPLFKVVIQIRNLDKPDRNLYFIFADKFM